jgi:hypothetical protein
MIIREDEFFLFKVVVEFILNFAKYFLRKNFKVVGKMDIIDKR